MNIRLISAGWLAVVAAVVSAPAAAAEPPARPAPAVTAPPQLDRLIEQLGNPDYFVRRRAEEQLAKLGFEAMDALNKAATHEDLEIAARARHLLALMHFDWADKNDPLQVREILKDYEHRGAEARATAMASLARLPGSAGAGALCRLVRYEPSLVLSKRAAILLLGDPKLAAAPPKPLAQLVVGKLAPSQRPAAEWLRTWARSAQDPSVMAGPWTRLVDAEQALLRTTPEQTSPEVVTTLLRFQVAWLRKLGRTEEMFAAMSRLVQLGAADPDMLGDLLEGLIARKDWKNLDRLVGQFRPQNTGNPDLVYLLAGAWADRGDPAAAERLAQQAMQLAATTESSAPGDSDEPFAKHLDVAKRLRARGRFAWAKRECQHLIAAADASGGLAVPARRELAVMLHDQGEDQEAGEVLQALVSAVEKQRPAGRPLPNGGPTGPVEIRSQMDYFFACHWERKGDRARQREFLDKALAENPADTEVLIACYRLPGAPAAYHEKIRKLIAQAAAAFSDRIADHADDFEGYNDLAWLVANTEGDMDAALRAAQKAVALAPQNGDLCDTLARVQEGNSCDTLAHVWFAKGDYEKAVQFQTKAVELAPHTHQIARQLAVYRKALAERKKAKPS